MAHTYTDLGGEVGGEGEIVVTSSENSPEISPQSSPPTSPKGKSILRIGQKGMPGTPPINSAILGRPNFAPGVGSVFGALIFLEKEGAGSGGSGTPTSGGGKTGPEPTPLEILHPPPGLDPPVDRAALAPRDTEGEVILPEMPDKKDPKTPIFGEGAGDRLVGEGIVLPPAASSSPPEFTHPRRKDGRAEGGSANFSDHPEEKFEVGSSNSAEMYVLAAQNARPREGRGAGDTLNVDEVEMSAPIVNRFGKLLSKGGEGVHEAKKEEIIENSAFASPPPVDAKKSANF